MKSRLSSLQHEVLAEFFRRQNGFFLTGGAALTGFYLGHRSTEDLDLFTAEADLDDGERSLREAAQDLGAEVESVRTAPDFRRRVVRRGNESVLVDLVLDRSSAGASVVVRDGIPLDAPEEILANKLCTLLSRAEIRDAVDVVALEQAGYPLDVALTRASEKDTGLTPAQLAWVVSEISLGADAVIPGPYSVEELRAYLRDLQERLTRTAFPDDD